ncbi:MAG: HAMP domain-containing sensor histidine kinase [Bacteroidia bacterium]
MRKTKALLTILVIYVVMQFCWWAYMLVDLNKEVFQHKIELTKIQVNAGNAQQSALRDLDKKLHSRFWMVAGEGAVFLILLIFSIQRLLVAYNKEMELARQQKNFLLSITHEFKSPLAAVKLNMQTMQRHKLESDKEKMIISSTIQEADRLNKLVENALMAAQIETHTYQLAKEKFDFSECIATNLQNRAVTLERTHIVTDIDKDIYITGDCTAATSILLNLIENAEKYSGDHPEIKVSLKQKNKEVILTVSDNGIGIADEEKGKIFEKFYRVGNEDTRNSKGTGLGLYIVKQLVDMHHAKISVLDNAPKGTIFQVTFTT